MAAVIGASLFMTEIARGQGAVPPPPAAPRAVNVPQAVEKTLANGLRVIVISKRDVPLVAFNLVVKTGSEADPAGHSGLAQITASTLTQGTKKRTAEQIAQGVEALGATLQAEAGWDATKIDVSVLSSKLPQALEYVADMTRNATFAAAEVERLRQQTLDSIRVEMGQPRSIAAFVAARVVYAGHAYGQSVTGTETSVGAITRDDLVAFHARYYRPENCVLVFGGDVAPARAFELAQSMFGAWKGGKMDGAAAAQAAPVTSLSPRVVVIDMPDAGQAAVVVARAGVRRVDPAMFPALVANSVLGGGYSSRLNQEVRIKRGLSYGAASAFELRREAGPFMARAETKNESAAEVAGIIVDELDRLGSSDITDSELVPRKAALIGNFGRSLETSSGLVARVATLALYGQDLDEVNRYIGNVQAVTPAVMREFSGKHLAGSASSVVIVGDAKKFIEALEARFTIVEVLPIAELNLDSATLRKK